MPLARPPRWLSRPQYIGIHFPRVQARRNPSVLNQNQNQQPQPQRLYLLPRMIQPILNRMLPSWISTSHLKGDHPQLIETRSTLPTGEYLLLPRLLPCCSRH